jgi:hypothetical protein
MTDRKSARPDRFGPGGALQEQYQHTVKLRDMRSSVNDALRGLDSLKAQIEERRKTLETQKKKIPAAPKTGIDGTLEELGKIVDGLARPTGKTLLERRTSPRRAPPGSLLSAQRSARWADERAAGLLR